MLFKDIKVSVHLSIGLANADRNEEVNLCDYIEEDAWNKFSDEERENYITEELVKEWAYEYICFGGEIIK